MSAGADGSPCRLHPIEQLVLEVVFQAPGGRRVRTIGGGRSLAEALTSARAALPEGRWSAFSWNPLSGNSPRRVEDDRGRSPTQRVRK